MIRKLIVIFLVLTTLHVVKAQVALKTESEVTNFESLPTESVFIHFNSSVLLVGEYLYYKLYCLNTDKDQFSSLSKLGYVEMISQTGEVVFKHKIVLKDGLGYGDFFIPTTVNSGSFKLIGYTNWMRNGKKELFFESDITIVNPYNGDDSQIKSKRTTQTDSLVNSSNSEIHDISFVKEEYQKGYPVEINLIKKEFGKRDKVELKLQVENDLVLLKNLSLSVRRTNEIPEPFSQSADRFISTIEKQDKQYKYKESGTIYLPELRGELVSGWVSTNNASMPVKDLTVTVSIPGENYFFKVLRTDAVGRFHFNIADNYAGNTLIFQVLAENAKDYKVQIRGNSVDFSDLEFNTVALDSAMRDVILQRSIHNQIENAFYAFRPDSLVNNSPTQFLEYKEKTVYDLNDYSRFKTFEETIVEILSEVSIKRLSKDKSAILIQGLDNVSSSDLPALILVDGCYIQNHDVLLGFDARKIKTLSVFRQKIILGPQLFRGALIINTNSGSDFTQFYDDDILSYADVVNVQLSKRYFVQKYTNEPTEQQNSHLPDDRLQLLWMPQLKMETKEIDIEFFTSDVTGNFEILLEGFTEKSDPISVRKTFFVK